MHMYGSVHLELALTVTAVLYGYTAAGDCSTEVGNYREILDTFKFFILDATSDPQLDLSCLTVKKNGPTQKLITTDSTTEESIHASYKAKYINNDDGEPRDGEASITAQGKIYATWKSENVSESLQLRVRFHYTDSCFVLEQVPQDNSGSKYYLFSSVNATYTDYEQCLEKLKEYTSESLTFPNGDRYCDPLAETLEEETKFDHF
ncbi:uncharacterized protein [Dermacentor albipictus]|uniref:uncharacterized protein n=1 Tax=Dermacentor albipictus TaxID=60249 RepID=UPI0031FE2D83